MMQDKAIRTLGSWGAGVLLGLAAACAGGDTPPRDDKLVGDLASVYAGGQPVASAAGAGGGGGNGGSGSTPSSTGGSDSGSGGSSMASAGSGSTTDPPAGGSGGSTSSGACDGFAVLKTTCGQSSCHGAEEPGFLTNFALDEETAKSYVGEKSASMSCADTSSIFDADNPSASLVVKKITATASGCGGRMPLGAAMQIPQADLDCIEEWIGDQ